MTYPNAVFSAFAFTGFIFCAIPLPWHLQAWNTGTCMYMIWTGLACLNQAINSVIWNGNAINWAPVWCDISARFIVGSSFAIPAASLCINRRLYHIACVRRVTTTKSDKRREIMIDLAIGVGIPVLGMILQYVVQGHRFNIYEDIGCYPFSFYVWPIYPIILLPPIFIGLVSATYSILTIIAFHKNRSQFSALLSANGNATSNRFIRLMLLASIEVLFTIPIALWNISLDVKIHPLFPWVSWASVHADFSRVDQFPSLLWRADLASEMALELSRWAVVFCAFAFFAFFGFADEARKNYKSAYQTIAKRVGMSTTSFGTGITSTGFLGSNGMKSKEIGSSGKVRPILPVFVHREMLRRQDSMDSFTDFSNMSISIADVGGTLNEKSSDPEKADFYPTLSYSGQSIITSDGETKDNDTLSPPASPASSSSSASTISYSSPSLTRQHSSIEISSVRHSTPFNASTHSLPLPTSNSQPTAV